MAMPQIVTVPLTPRAEGHRRLLVVGPSLGTGVEALWGSVAQLLADRFSIIGWELPGHGRGAPCDEPFTVADLADGVAAAIPTGSFVYAGDSLGGAVGLQLLLRYAERVESAVLIATGTVIGTPQGWHERAALVRRETTAAVVAGSRQRWFAPGNADAGPALARLDSLRATDAESYARCCEALAEHDVRSRLHEIAAPVLAAAGAHDQVTTTASLAEIADGVQRGTLHVIADAAHLPPAETPQQVADLIVAAAG